MAGSENRPAGAVSEADGPRSIFPRATAGRYFPRPDLWQRYPDPTASYRRMTWGLGLAALRAEWTRCRDAGWLPWELEVRFPASRGEVVGDG